MKRQKLEKYVCDFYIPLVLAVGGFGYVFRDIGSLSIVLLTPALLLTGKNKQNVFFLAYLSTTFIYSLATTQYFGLGINTHDFLAIVICYSIFSFCAKNVDLLKSSRYFRKLIFLQLLISIAVGMIESNFYSGGSVLPHRFLGATLNPNQLGLYAFATGVIIWYLPNAVSQKYVWCSICLIVAISSGSDAVFAAIIVTLLMALTRAPTLRIIAILAAVILVMFSPFLVPGGSVDFLAQQQVFERLNRWLFVIPLVFEYPLVVLVGFGPGPYGPSFENTFLSGVIVPGNSDISATEFHNSILDFFVSFGVIGTVIFGRAILTCCGRIQYSPLFFGLVTFSLFHLSYRHPIFWVAILFAIIGPSGLSSVITKQSLASKTYQ